MGITRSAPTLAQSPLYFSAQLKSPALSEEKADQLRLYEVCRARATPSDSRTMHTNANLLSSGRCSQSFHSLSEKNSILRARTIQHVSRSVAPTKPPTWFKLTHSISHVPRTTTSAPFPSQAASTSTTASSVS